METSNDNNKKMHKQKEKCSFRNTSYCENHFKMLNYTSNMLYKCFFLKFADENTIINNTKRRYTIIHIIETKRIMFIFYDTK